MAYLQCDYVVSPGRELTKEDIENAATFVVDLEGMDKSELRTVINTLREKIMNEALHNISLKSGAV